MKQVWNTLRISMLAVLILSGVGCRDKIYPVEGVVKMDGQPLEGVVVTLQTADGGNPATASTANDGRFKILSANGSGVRAGEYQVTLSKITNREPDRMPPWVRTQKPPTPEQRAAYEKQLQAEVAKQIHWVPEKYTKPGTTPVTYKVPSKEELVIELESKDLPGGKMPSPK